MFAPEALTCFSLPTDARRTGGILIVAMSGRLPGSGAERLVVGEHTELLVGDLLRRARADRALGVAVDLDLAQRRAQRVVQEQPSDRGLADADDQLDDLG